MARHDDILSRPSLLEEDDILSRPSLAEGDDILNRPSLKQPSKLYPLTAGAAGVAAGQWEKGNVGRAAGMAGLATPAAAALETLSVPWNLSTRGITTVAEKTAGALGLPGGDTRPWGEVFAEADPGFSEPIKTGMEAIGIDIDKPIPGVGQAVDWASRLLPGGPGVKRGFEYLTGGGKRIEEEGMTPSDIANWGGLVGDFFGDPAGKVKIARMTSKGLLNNFLRANAKRFGYQIDDATGALFKMVDDGGGGARKMMATPQEVVEAGVREAVTLPPAQRTKMRKQLKVFQKEAKGIDPQTFKIINPENKTYAGLVEEGLMGSNLGAIPGFKPVEKVITKAMWRGRADKDMIDRTVQETMQYLGDVASIKVRGQSALAKAFNDVPEFADELTRRARENIGTKDLFADVVAEMEMPRFKEIGTAGEVLDPVGGDFTGLIEAVPWADTPAAKLARRLKELTGDLLEAEAKEGVAKKLRQRFSPEAEKMLAESVERGDYGSMDEAAGDFFRTMDEYKSPQHYFAGRGFEKHKAFKGMETPADIIEPGSMIDYAPRNLSGESIKLLKEVRPLLNATNKDEKRVLDFVNGVLEPKVRTSESPGARGLNTVFRQQRGDVGGKATFSELRQHSRDMMEFDADEAREITTAVDYFLKNNKSKKAKKIMERLREDGIFENNPIKSMERRVTQSAKAIATKRLADRIAANPDFVNKSGTEFMGKGNVPIKGSGGRTHYTMDELFTGLEGRHKGVAVHPEVGEYLKSINASFNDVDGIYGWVTQGQNSVRKMLLMRPFTAARNMGDSQYKNATGYGKDMALGNFIAAAAIADGKPVQMIVPGARNKLFRVVKGASRNVAELSPEALDMRGRTFVTNAGERISTKQFGDELLEYGVLLDEGNRYNLSDPKKRDLFAAFDRKAKEPGLPGALKRGFGKAGAVVGGIKKSPDWVLYASSEAENYGRSAAYVIERLRGKTPVQAAVRAHGRHWTSALPDDLPVRIQRMTGGKVPASAFNEATRNLFTFFYFSRKNVPFWWKEMVENPWRSTFPIKLKETMEKQYGDLPDEALMGENFRISPFHLGLEERKDKRGRTRTTAKYLNLSNTLSQIEGLNMLSWREPMRQLTPWLQGLGSLGELGLTGEVTHPFYGKKLESSPDIAAYFAGQAFPPISFARRPLEAAAPEFMSETLGLTDIYPEESLGHAATQTFLDPLRESIESLEYQQRQAKGWANKQLKKGGTDIEEAAMRAIRSGSLLREYESQQRQRP